MNFKLEIYQYICEREKLDWSFLLRTSEKLMSPIINY